MAATQALPGRINEELLSCQICFLQYTSENLPKMLSCSHTFCEKCIKDFINSKNKGKSKQRFACPLCRKESYLEGGVTKLPNNYTVLHLIDIVKGVGDDTVQCSESSPPSAHHLSLTDHTTTKCCRCATGTGSIVIKCQHKICVECRAREKAMDVGAIPCQICLNMQNGVDYYSEQNPPPFCEHGSNVRPPSNNPGYQDYYNDQYYENTQDGYNNQYMDQSQHVRYPQETVQVGQYTPGYQQGAHGASWNQYTGAAVPAQQAPTQQVPVRVPAQQVPVQVPAQPEQYTPQMYTTVPVTDKLCDDFSSQMNLATSGYQYPSTYSQSYSHTQYDTTSDHHIGTTVPAHTSTTHQTPHYHHHSTPPPGNTQAPVQTPAVPHTQDQRILAAGAPGQITYQESDPRDPERDHMPPPSYSEVDPNPCKEPTPPPTKRVVRRPAPKPDTTQRAKPAEHLAKVQAPSEGSRSSAGSDIGTGNKETASQDGDKERVKGGVAVFPASIEQEILRKASSDIDSSSVRDHTGTKRQTKATRHPVVIPATPPNLPAGTRHKVETWLSEGQVPEPKANPKVPPRRLTGEPQGLPFKCVKKFGRYSENKMQSGAFQKPYRVSSSRFGECVLVTDTQEMTVQIFTSEGVYVNKFKVLGVQGACLWATDKIAVATHHGIEVYSKTGHQESELPIGPCINVIPFKYGFLAVKQKSIVFFDNTGEKTKELTRRRIKTSTHKKHVSFDSIKDVAVSVSKDIAVLESTGDAYIIDDDGNVKLTIQPHTESCGKLQEPFSITYDRWSNIFIADLQSRRVLRFSPNGKYSRCILNFTLGETATNQTTVRAYGLSSSSEADHLLIIVAGNKCAEVRLYKLY